jgi:hypothetical protein
MVVVTEEFAGKSRIPDVCVAEKIDSCRLADLIEREDWKIDHWDNHAVTAEKQRGRPFDPGQSGNP